MKTSLGVNHTKARENHSTASVCTQPGSQAEVQRLAHLRLLSGVKQTFYVEKQTFPVRCPVLREQRT